MHRLLERQLRKLGIDETPTPEQWQAMLARIDRAYTEADQDRYTLERSLELSSTEMRTRYDELRGTQRALITASRKAGMADVATSVLHNIGNVLNSANVSTRIICDLLKKSPRSGLGKTLGVLSSKERPGLFIDEDPRGRKLLPYLSLVDRALTQEQERISGELANLTKHIDHIKAIVNDQLKATRNKDSGLILERASIDELVQDALDLCDPTEYPVVSLVRELDSFVAEVDRHKLTQVIVNLVRNAYEAVAATGQPGTVYVRAHRGENCHAILEVEDTGMGVEESVKHQIFGHGFTTKESGNGYGLHHSSCVAIELGGTLTCSSDGAGRGARFTLRFPRRRPGSGSSGAWLCPEGETA